MNNLSKAFNSVKYYAQVKYYVSPGGVTGEIQCSNTFYSVSIS